MKKYKHIKKLNLPFNIDFTFPINVKNAIGYDYEQIDSIIGSPGWYYDRYLQKCWYELPDGTACTCKTRNQVYYIEDFKNTLKMLNASEKPLNHTEMNALELILKIKHISKSTKDELANLYNNNYFNNVEQRITYYTKKTLRNL